MNDLEVTVRAGSDLDYYIDWTDWLGGDAIVSSTWAVPAESALQKHDEQVHDLRRCVVWLAGGKPGRTVWEIVNSIITMQGRKDSRRLLITVEKK